MARAKAKKAGKAKAKAVKSKPVKKSAKRPTKPIELYYWPTPNGFKISIMLEECGLPYTLKPVNISKANSSTPTS